jgi:hypothetical protein
VISDTDENLSCAGENTLILRMAAQAEVGILLHQHLPIGRAMRIVAGRATFSQRLVFKDNGPRLFAMAPAAAFVNACHGKSTGWFKDVRAMGIMTLHAVHFPFSQRMVLRKIEFSVSFEMALEARLGIFTGIND